MDGALLVIPHGESGSRVTSVQAAEGVAAEVVIEAERQGVLTHARTVDGRAALRFPEYQEFQPALAIVTWWPFEADPHLDPFEPGSSDFSFGADFMQDKVEEGVPPEDGSNLLQRGLYSQPSQFKLEVDQGRPGCRVAGSAGDVQVRVGEAIAPATWYRVSCRRTLDGVEIQLESISDDGSTTLIESVFQGGTTGHLSWDDPSPLALGGKLNPDGDIAASAPDQFNGAVTRPFLVID